MMSIKVGCKVMSNSFHTPRFRIVPFHGYICYIGSAEGHEYPDLQAGFLTVRCNQGLTKNH